LAVCDVETADADSVPITDAGGACGVSRLGDRMTGVGGVVAVDGRVALPWDGVAVAVRVGDAEAGDAGVVLIAPTAVGALGGEGEGLELAAVSGEIADVLVTCVWGRLEGVLLTLVGRHAGGGIASRRAVAPASIACGLETVVLGDALVVERAEGRADAGTGSERRGAALQTVEALEASRVSAVANSDAASGVTRSGGVVAAA